MKSAHSSGGVIHANLSESEFLRLEADKARSNITRSLKNAKDAFSQGVDPRIPMRKHPLIAIGAAAVIGFVATLVTIPSKQERELRRLERVRRAMYPEPVHPPQGEPSKAVSNGIHEKPKASVWLMLLTEIVAFAKPILVAQITNKIREQSQHSTPDQPPVGQ